MENHKIEINEEQLDKILNKYLYKIEHKEEIKKGRKKLRKLQKYIMNELEDLWCQYFTFENNNDINNMNYFKKKIEHKQIELKETNYKLYGPNKYEEYIKIGIVT